VEVIDGTGAAPLADQTIVLERGRISAVGPSASAHVPSGAHVLELPGHTVYPGLVGMHEHLFYTEPQSAGLHQYAISESLETAPRLYLAAGVTTARTTGSIEPYTDINIKTAIDSGKLPGPNLDVTGPYLEGAGGFSPQMHSLSSAADATATVNYWAGEGATSFKAYMDITPEELKAAIDAAHAHGLKITGHLCSIGFTEAAAMGIDNLEHGIAVDTEFYPGKKPGLCPGQRPPEEQMADSLDIAGPQVQAMVHDLVIHHVAVTSTLAIFESFIPNLPSIKFLQREQGPIMPQAWTSVLLTRAQIAERPEDPSGMFCSRKKCSLNVNSSQPEVCWWPAAIRLDTAPFCLDSAINAIWSYWCRRDSRQSRPFRSIPKMARSISGGRTASAPSLLASRLTWSS
jgi:hypothetical protein